MTIKAQTRTDMPRGAAVLGFAGVIPFAAGAVGVWVLEDSGLLATAFYGQMLYGAVIFSFLGGVHWGLGIAEFGAPDDDALLVRRLGWSVVPSLLAWIAAWLVFAEQEQVGLTLLIVTGLGLFWGDVAAIRRRLSPPWYLILRRHLTALVILCLGATWIRVALA